MPVGEKKVLGTYLLTSLINTGRCIEAEGSAVFLTAIYEELSKRKDVLDDVRICELGRQLNIKYVCIATVTPAFGFFMVSARIVQTGTGKVFFSGEAPSLLKTMDDLTQVSNKVVENMLGMRITSAQAEHKFVPARTSDVAETGHGAVPAVRSLSEIDQAAMSNAAAQPKPTKVTSYTAYISKARNDYYDHPQQAPKTTSDTNPRPKYSLGSRLDINQAELYLRLFGENTHGYFGFAYTYDWLAYKLSGFLEWRTRSEVFNVYGGPGLALGYYKSSGGSDGSMGIFVGAQVGFERRWGAFAVGTNLRLGYVIAQSKGSFDYAIGVGPSYIERKASNE